MLSARAGEEAKVEGLEAGVDDYLTKPFSARELLARVTANIAMSRIRARGQGCRRCQRGARAGTGRARSASPRRRGDRRNMGLGCPERSLRRRRPLCPNVDIDEELCRNGLPLEQVLASIHEGVSGSGRCGYGEVLGDGGGFRCEYRVRQHDGTYRWIEANGRVDLDMQGRPLRFPGVLIDVDHRHRIEWALRQLNEQLEERVAKAIAERESCRRRATAGAKDGSCRSTDGRSCARFQ